MKGTKYVELSSLDNAQLEKQIAENRARLTALEFQKVIGQLDNHAQISTLKRDIARMSTVISSRKSSATK